MRAIVDIPPRNVFPRARALELLMTGVVALNRELIAKLGLPPLMESGVRYRRDAPGAEVWSNAYSIIQKRFDDCEGLSGYLAAEMQNDGYPAFVCVKRTGRTKLHAQVCADGHILDPSRALGMKSRRRK